VPERRRGSGGSRQPDLFTRSKQPKISLPDNHPMVVLTDTVDWTEMEVRAEKIRAKKLKSGAGRLPHLRATLGALTLMALRRLPYPKNVDRLRELGVRDVGLSPRGSTPWEVQGAVKARVIKQRALVEGSIGTIKCSKYGFNRPAARSVAMIGVCGQRAVLGLNLTKLARGAAERRGIALAS